MIDFRRRHQEYKSEMVESSTTDWTSIKRLIKYLRPYTTILVLAILFLICSKSIDATVPVLIGRLSQKILDHAGIDATQSSAVLEHIIYFGFGILALLCFSYLLDSLNVVLKSIVGQKGLYRLRQQVYNHVLHMPLAYFDRNTVGRLMTRTIHDIDQINQMFSESVIPIIGNIILFFGIFVGITYIDWRITLLVLVILPLVWWLTHRFRYYQRICYNRVRTVVAAMNTFVQEHLMGASTIRNFGLQSRAKKQFEEINDDYCNAYVESVHHFSFFIAGIDFIQNLSLISAFILIVAFTPTGANFDAGIYFTFSLYALMFFRPLADLAERYNVLQSAMAAAARIFNILDQPSENKIDIGNAKIDGIESIEFEDVWFAYEDENWVLKGLTMQVQHGKSYAIVGITGEGKSTILSLLLRYYEPQKGHILINGRDIREYSLENLRHQFSIVLQDPVIFSGTIADNLTMFDKSITASTVNEVVDYLGMRPFINKFSNGIDHNLHERGQGLSVGEMQLISLARAITNKRSVLILDEATANIDSITEQMMQRAIAKALGRQTALVIAHRLSTIKDVTTILVLQNGKVAEIGTHRDLLQKGGVYEKLYRLQFTDES